MTLKKILVSSLCFSLLLVAGMLLFSGSKASAHSLNPPDGSSPYFMNPNPSPWYIPNANLYNLSDDCARLPAQSPAYTQWVSPNGTPSSTSLSVPYGAASIDLEYRFSAANCWGNQATTDSWVYISNASGNPGGTVNGIVGQMRGLNHEPRGQVGIYRDTNIVFSYAPVGGFTQSGIYQISLTTHVSNRFHTGQFNCASQGPGYPQTLFDENFTGWCRPDQPTFDIYVDVQPPAAGSIYVSKYEPPSHPANGYFFDVDDPVNDATSCVTNAGGFTFACNQPGANLAHRRNGWRVDGVLAQGYPHNLYRVSVDVPSGWIIAGSNAGNPSCNGPGGNTGTCTVEVEVYGGLTTFVDFWFAENGSIYVSKYNGPSHPANGNFNDVDPAVNLARACANNAQGNQTNPKTPFACSTDPGRVLVLPYNGWNLSGIWTTGYPNNPYSISVDVPSGWSVASTNQASFTCTLPGNRGICTTSSFTVNPGQTTFVDFWFEPAPEPPCSTVRYLDPSASNNEFGESPEVGQPIIAEFVPPSFPSGVTQFTIDNFVINPAGLTGLSGSRSSALPGTVQFGPVTSASPQIYNYTYRLTWAYGGAGGSESRTCTGELRITTKPYMRVYGNDVKTGGGLAPSCSPTNDKATILTFARMTPGASASQEDWKGSATQFAAFALGEISQFLSAGQNSPRTNTPPGSNQARPVLDLTFGNFDPADSIASRGNTNTGLFDTRKVEGYGGMSGMGSCIENYYNTLTTNGGSNFAANTMNTRTITTPVAEYHDGDLYINGNINLGGSWIDGAGKTNIPSFYLVVRGNIYIRNEVSNLDGVFIAQEDPTRPNTGRIYTCATGIGDVPTATSQYGTCRYRLTVNGAFIARQVKFLRSIDSLRDGAPNEAAGASRAAEVFNFSPETYLAEPNAALRRGSQKTQYDFITSLPPVL